MRRRRSWIRLLHVAIVVAPEAAQTSLVSRSSGSSRSNGKRVVFLRHGCTYMNEYLGKGVSFGAPGFTDAFDPETELRYYRDSPLSELGQSQAKALGAARPKFLKDCDLIVTSPLTRALQTLDGGLWTPMKQLGLDRTIPVLALPHAAERLYLISDVGRPVPELSREFEYVDFASGFGDHSPSSWWYRPAAPSKDHVHGEEWRPTGQGQRYACPGEPEAAFDARMESLYEWIVDRPESKIAVVCHWGVIKWMLGADFGNCQWREVAVSDLRPARRADGQRRQAQHQTQER